MDFCARSVIGGDPNLDTEQVGVPRRDAALYRADVGGKGVDINCNIAR